MTSDKQIAANQQNAQRSTGPENTENSKWSALTHGMTGQFPFLPYEDPDEYVRFCWNFVEDYAPNSKTALHLILKVAQNHWRLERGIAFENNIIMQATCQSKMMDELLKVTRYQTAIDRCNVRMLKEFRQLRAEKADPQWPQVSHDQLLDMALDYLRKTSGPHFCIGMPLHAEDNESYREHADDVMMALGDPPPEEPAPSKAMGPFDPNPPAPLVQSVTMFENPPQQPTSPASADKMASFCKNDDQGTATGHDTTKNPPSSDDKGGQEEGDGTKNRP